MIILHEYVGYALGNLPQYGLHVAHFVGGDGRYDECELMLNGYI